MYQPIASTVQLDPVGLAHFSVGQSEQFLHRCIELLFARLEENVAEDFIHLIMHLAGGYLLI
jgi:hypothetical protein